MGKYIITFEDYPQMEEDGVKFYSCNEAPWWYASEQIISKLTPYTEPDTEKVSKEAYDKGYQDANVKISSNEQAIAEKAYQRGLIDAWDAARKIVFSREDGGLFSYEERKAVFGCGNYMALKNYSASEAIEKIRQYEQEKEEQIQVGDEVITASGKAVVIGVGPVHLEYIYADGSNGFGKVKNAKKTGRHFPEIAEVLRKMKEEKE